MYINTLKTSVKTSLTLKPYLNTNKTVSKPVVISIKYIIQYIST